MLALSAIGVLVVPLAGLFGCGLYDAWSDPGGRTMFALFAAGVWGTGKFEHEHAEALAEGDELGAWDRAVAAIEVEKMTDSRGRRVGVVVDPNARVVALLVPDDFDLPWLLEFVPPEDPAWRAPVELVREGASAHLQGTPDAATIDAVRASGTDLAWTLHDHRIDWRSFQP